MRRFATRGGCSTQKNNIRFGIRDRNGKGYKKIPGIAVTLKILHKGNACPSAQGGNTGQSKAKRKTEKDDGDVGIEKGGDLKKRVRVKTQSRVEAVQLFIRQETGKTESLTSKIAQQRNEEGPRTLHQLTTLWG